MPFVKRIIDPVYIRRKGLADTEITLGEEHEVIVNYSYTQVLLQLSQLATFANEIFTDLSTECKQVIDRTQQMKTRIWKVERDVNQQNLLDTPLPESTLQTISDTIHETPTLADKPQETALFTAASRPDCLTKLYQSADVTPRAVYAALGPTGYKAAKNFCLAPVMQDAGETKFTPILHQRRERKIDYERTGKLRPLRNRTCLTRPKSAHVDYHISSRLPTPEETNLKSFKSQPSVIVEIDTSNTAFERFASSRASLRNLERHRLRSEVSDSPASTLSHDTRRRTISGMNDLRQTPLEQTNQTTQGLLYESNSVTNTPKNPDKYKEDLYADPRTRSRSKDKRISVRDGVQILKRIVKRSKSLPRNMGRTEEALVAPNLYATKPVSRLTVIPGAVLNEKSEKVFTNFYGAPNTEIPSPETFVKLKKSKSDHELSSLGVGKNDKKSKKRPRSVSTDRCLSTNDKRAESLSRTFSGLFRSRKTKTPEPPKSQLGDSLSVFSCDEKKKTGSQITLRKRDSKATTSSGRWSGSERFSMDSDVIFSSTSNRLSRVSADRDSALGAEINDHKMVGGDSGNIGGDSLDNKSMFSVDQDGFYTTMHRDIHLHDYTDGRTALGTEVELNQASSARTSTITLNQDELADQANNSTESDQTDEILKRVLSKVEAGKTINRYSLVAALSDEELRDLDVSPGVPHSHLRKSVTYESELDLVLEDMSETGTIHSDSESVISVRVRQPSVRRKLKTSPNDKTKNPKQAIQKTKSYQPDSCSDCQKEQAALDYPRNCRSLPRDIKNSVRAAASLSDDQIKSIIANGSWPRNLNHSTKLKDPGVKLKNGTKTIDSAMAMKRRSLSPGKLKAGQQAADKHRVENLIIEARRMSALTPQKSGEETPNETKRTPCATAGFMTYLAGADNFKRQPSYRMACKDSVQEVMSPTSPEERTPRRMRRNFSYRLANNRFTPSQKLPEGREVINQKPAERPKSISGYNLTALDRASRAPSYRIANQTIYDADRPDSGCGLIDENHVSSASSVSNSMTSSYDSGHSEGTKSSYRAAIESTDEAREKSILQERSVKACMKSVYANMENHLSTGVVPKNTELVPIKYRSNEHIYATPMINPPAKSFHPHYVNIDPNNIISHSSHVVTTPDLSRSLHDSPKLPLSNPPIRSESSFDVSRKTNSSNVTLTPPARPTYRKRPNSTYIPNDVETCDMIPDNKLMSHKKSSPSQQSVFTSMELLKRDEMAMLSILGKIRNSTRPHSFIQTDI